jgi:UDP:flavonoid glycosyltransferase YjiC (YdhE family)
VRVLLSTYDSRGGVEPLLGLAVRLQALGAEVLVCAPPDCAERLAEVGRVAAVVHHGGAGTTTTATRAGVPQVVVPQWADQPYFASRVADLGIGAAHDVQAPATESLSAALSTALLPQTRVRAAAVADTIRTDGAAVAATLLLEAASRTMATRS